MPRPGPRPYECVRRAWHSDRHQPMRGTLIQEIFRIANEVHSPATRKNKEWQEKLPVVVLKAEEIMYSKANSEAEYMDPKTLWERANDAIDIIIRRDDTPETGDLLQPCIEAALNLGCIARRASRSQRHNNPEFYLSTSRKETTATSPNISESIKAHPGSSTCMLPSPPPHPSNSLSPTSQPASWYPAYMKSTSIKPGYPQVIGSFSRNPSHEQASILLSNHDFPILCKDAPLSGQEESLSVPVRTFNWPLMGRAYPLCYIDNNPLVVSQPSIPNPQAPLSNTATITASHLRPSTGGASTRFRQNFLENLDCTTTMNASNKSSNLGETSEKPSNTVYDLSLRLGLPSPPQDELGVDDVESSIDGGKSCYLSFTGARATDIGYSLQSLKDRGFYFLNVDNTEELSESCSSKESSEGEVFYHEASGGKKRVPIGPSTKDGYISWKQNTSRDRLFNR